MKYIIIDQTKTDMFTKEFDNQAEAVKVASEDFAYLTEADKKQRTDYFVIESCDPDEESAAHFDGRVVARFI